MNLLEIPIMGYLDGDDGLERQHEMSRQRMSAAVERMNAHPMPVAGVPAAWGRAPVREKVAGAGSPIIKEVDDHA